jgi:hypothetical protein
MDINSDCVHSELHDLPLELFIMNNLFCILLKQHYKEFEHCFTIKFNHMANKM